MIGKCIAVAACRGGDKPWVTKHFDLDIEDGSFGFAVSQARVAAEAALDGLYVIRTSVEASDMTAEQAVLNYKRLAEVERAFRTLKGIDLQVRPIRHRPEGRVKAHIFLSMLAYYVQWRMIQAWAPLTFKDEAGAHVARARSRGAGKALAGCARQGAHAHAGRWLAGVWLHAALGASGDHRAQHAATQGCACRRGDLHAHHPAERQTATSPQSARYPQNVRSRTMARPAGR